MPKTDYDALLRELEALERPSPDYSLGLTVNEWANLWSHGETKSRIAIHKGIKAGLWRENTAWRPRGKRWYRTPVFRPVSKSWRPPKEI